MTTIIPFGPVDPGHWIVELDIVRAETNIDYSLWLPLQQSLLQSQSTRICTGGMADVLSHPVYPPTAFHFFERD